MIYTHNKNASRQIIRITKLTGTSALLLLVLLSTVSHAFSPAVDVDETHHLEAGAAIELNLPQTVPDFLIVHNLGIDSITTVLATDGQPLRSHGSWRNREGRYVVSLRHALSEATPAPASLRISSSEAHVAAGSVRLQWLDRGQAAIEPHQLLSTAAEGSALIMSEAASATAHAAAAFDKAANIATTAGLLDWQADLRFEQAATSYARLGALDNASELLQMVIGNYDQLNDQRGVAAASNLLGLVFLHLGRQDAARQLFNTAIALRENQHSEFYLAEAMNNLALVHWRQDHYAEAAHLYERALQTLIRRDDLSVAEFIRLNAAQSLASHELSLVAATLNNLALVESSSGDLEYAESAWLLAHQLAERTADAARMGQIEKNLGWLYQRQGRLQQALTFLQQALAGHQQRHDNYWAGETLTVLGDLYASIGEYELAISHYRNVLDLSDDRNRQHAFVLSQLADAYWKQNQVTMADDLFKQALQLVDAVSEPGTHAVMLSKYAMLQYSLGETATALAAHQQAVAVLTEIGNVREAARARSRYGRMLLQSGDIENARQMLEQALSGHRQVADELFELETLLALSYTRAQTAMALQDAAQAAFLAQNIDAGDNSDALQLGFMHTVHDAQGRYIDLLLAEGRSEQAFLAADSIRARDLQQQLGPHGAINDLPTLAELQRSLPTDTVLLSYFLGTKQSHLWLLSTEGLQHHQLPAAELINAAATELADNLRQPRQSPGKIDWLSRRLSELVLHPVASQLSGQQLVIVADGNLQLVPFSLLSMQVDDSNERPALETRYAPSASVFAALAKTPARPLQSLLVLADPMSTATSTSQLGQQNMVAANEEDSLLTMRSARQSGIVPDRLPGARLEAQQIAAVASDQYRVNLRLGADANRRFVGHGGLRHHDIVHFATHGVVDKDLPALSALVLAPEQNQQATYLYASEIRELQLNAELVVLSGCDTGIGKAVAGHGLMSLSRPFLTAGARQVVASLWQVSDQATAELMEQFYRNLLNDGQSTQQALQSAQQWMQQQSRWQHPYYWAGFIITGA